MSLLTIKQLSAISGISAYVLREMCASGELASVRRAPRCKIYVEPSAWEAWKAAHTQQATTPACVVPLNPPKRAPVTKTEPTDCDDLLPKGFKRPFPKARAS